MKYVFFFVKQKTAYEMRISDWSSDVCSSDLLALKPLEKRYVERRGTRRVVLLRGPRDNLRYEDVAAALGGRAKRIRQFIVTPDTDKADAVEVNIVLACANAREYDGIRAKLCNLADVREIEPRES